MRMKGELKKAKQDEGKEMRGKGEMKKSKTR